MDTRKGFTLVEIIVVVIVIALLAGIVLFGVVQFINKGKDATIQGGLATLVPAGEAYYKAAVDSFGSAKQNSYSGFCASQFVQNTFASMPIVNPGCSNSSGYLKAKNIFLASASGITNQDDCCNVSGDGQSWAACVQEYTYPKNAFCVDSSGIRKEICAHSCSKTITSCPDDAWPNC